MLDLRLAAAPESVAVVRQAVGGIGEALGCDEAAIADLKLAVSEASTNVVVHAYERPDGNAFQVIVTRQGRLLNVVVSDAGQGFGGTGSTRGLGLGIPIARSVSASLAVQSRHGPGAGTEVSMAFVLPDEGHPEAT